MREIARVSPFEQARDVQLQINSLKSRLIGLTQQQDKLLGRPVAERMIVTVDVPPSPFNIREQQKAPTPLRQSLKQQQSGQRLEIDFDAMTNKEEFDARVEDDLTYDPRTIELARKTNEVSHDLRCSGDCHYDNWKRGI